MKKVSLLTIMMLCCCFLFYYGKSEMEAETEPKKENTVIEIAMWGGEERYKITRQVCELYMKEHPDIRFEYSTSGWDGYFEKLSMQAASGSMPDVVQMDYMYLQTYAKNGSLMDMQSLIEKGILDTSDINPLLIEKGIVEGRFVGMPISETILSIGYNARVFEAAGIDEPESDWTWDTFKETCKEITEKTGNYAFYIDFSTDMSFFRYWVRQFGYDLFNEDTTELGYEDDQICADYFLMWKDLINKGYMLDVQSSAEFNALKNEKSPIITGQVAMLLEWNNFANKMREYSDDLKIVTPPKRMNSSEQALWLKPGMYWSIAETSEVKEEAAEFIQWFLYSEEANELMMGERGTPVVGRIRTHLMESGVLDESAREMFEQLNAEEQNCGETPQPEPIGMLEITEAFRNAGEKVYYGESDALEAAKVFRQEANAILKKKIN